MQFTDLICFLFYLLLIQIFTCFAVAPLRCSPSEETRHIQIIQQSAHDIANFTSVISPGRLLSPPRGMLIVSPYVLVRLAGVANACKAELMQELRILELLEPLNSEHSMALHGLVNAYSRVHEISLVLAELRFECRQKMAAGKTNVNATISKREHAVRDLERMASLVIFPERKLRVCQRYISWVVSKIIPSLN